MATKVSVPKEIAAVAAPNGGVRLFGKWDAQEVEVKDISLQDYIALRNAVYVPHTAGRYATKAFKKASMRESSRLPPLTNTSLLMPSTISLVQPSSNDSSIRKSISLTSVSTALRSRTGGK